MKLIATLAMCLLALGSFAARNGTLHITGKTLEVDLADYKETSAKFVSYRVYHDDRLIKAGKSTIRGQFDIELDFGAKYVVVFMEERYVNKTINIDLTEPGTLVLDKGYKFRMDVTLFKADDHSDFSFLAQTPYVNAYIDGDKMKVDSDHMKIMQDKIDMAFRETNGDPVVEKNTDQ